MRNGMTILLAVLLPALGCGSDDSSGDGDAGDDGAVEADGADGDADGDGDGDADADGDDSAGADGDAEAGTLESLPLVQAEDLRYVGAFRLPAGTFGGSSFAYGGTALAFNPGGPSLYVVGHDWEQMVAEIDIPAAAAGSDRAALPTATVLQPFVDASAGLMATVDVDTIKVGGLLVAGGELVGSVFSYYDADGTQVLSHFLRPLDLAATGARGMYAVGELGAGVVSGYMAEVPEAWREALGARYLTGQCCIPIVSRTSYGPAVFGFDPAALGPSGPAAAGPLVYYPSEHPLSAWDSTGPLFNGSTEVRGLVFPVGTRSVLFFGRHGTGTFCYGIGSECGDPVDDSHGTHAYPYAYQVWAYDALELRAVHRGEVEPWAVAPYATWEPVLPFGEDSAHLNGAAYDPATGRLWLSQAFGDGDLPVVYQLALEPG
jgi:hypothetical protein